MDTHLAEAGKDRETTSTTTDPTIGDLDYATSVFVRARPGLLKIANRIVGNANEAEDVIQETWLRWQDANGRVVTNPRALLRTITVRLAINVVQSGWRRRESCATPWLPELADIHATPEAAAERQDTVERAVLLLMQTLTLTPRQRAAFVLRQGFGYPYGRISEILRLVSFTLVGQTVEGLMGIAPDAANRTATTQSRLPSGMKWLQSADVPIGKSTITVRHDGATKTTLTNNARGGAYRWEARFPGSTRRPRSTVSRSACAPRRSAA